MKNNNTRAAAAQVGAKELALSLSNASFQRIFSCRYGPCTRAPERFKASNLKLILQLYISNKPKQIRHLALLYFLGALQGAGQKIARILVGMRRFGLQCMCSKLAFYHRFLRDYADQLRSRSVSALSCEPR